MQSHPNIFRNFQKQRRCIGAPWTSWARAVACVSDYVIGWQHIVLVWGYSAAGATKKSRCHLSKMSPCSFRATLCAQTPLTSSCCAFAVQQIKSLRHVHMQRRPVDISRRTTWFLLVVGLVEFGLNSRQILSYNGHGRSEKTNHGESISYTPNCRWVSQQPISFYIDLQYGLLAKVNLDL